MLPRRRQLLLAAPAAVLGSAALAVVPRLQVGPEQRLTRLAQAAREAPDGAVIEVDPGDYVADVAVWLQRRLTIEGRAPGVRLLAGGASAEGKAIWVLRQGDFTVRHLSFIGARVRDRNGAGIRLEGGRLRVQHCRFLDSESGILTTSRPEIELDIEHSEFGHLGAGDGYSHAVYAGAIARLRLSACHLHHARTGHLVKSRARQHRIEYNRLTDGADGQASYELEFPNGGEAEVVGNVVQQSAGSRKAVMVAFGAEGYRWPLNRLAMAHNTLVNERRFGGVFVRVAAGAQAVWLRNNLWVGPGRLDLPAGVDAQGDRRSDRADALVPEPAPGPATDLPESLRPRFEPHAPLEIRPLGPGPLAAGALQAAPR